MSTRDTILAEIEAFRQRTGMSATRFGELAVNDPAFLLKFGRGRKIEIDTLDRLRAFMAGYVPKDTKTRPKPHTEAAA
jgi:hypothetical protein